MTLKTIGHLFYATSSSLHHFVAIGEFKLVLQSGNAQFGSKLMILFCRVTLKFDGWPWKTIGHLFYATSSFVHHFVAIGVFKLDLRSGNGYVGSWPLWPWPLTLTFCMDVTSVNGNKSSNFRMIRWQEHWQRGVTNGQTDGQADRRK